MKTWTVSFKLWAPVFAARRNKTGKPKILPEATHGCTVPQPISSLTKEKLKGIAF